MHDGPIDRSPAYLIAEELQKVSPRYSPILHLVATVGICLSVMVVSAMKMGNWPKLVIVLPMLLVCNFVEWFAHRQFLHTSRRGFRILFKQHTLQHHRMYHEECMGVSDRREWYFVLMPAKAMLGIALLAVPVMLLITWWRGADAGWTVMLVVGFYAGLYEVMHLCYHLPAGHPARQARVMQLLARHHARHHNPKFVQSNLNVTLPFMDAVAGTMAPK